ncbi:MAG: L-ribulose-5-phosphate 3-epimerase [Chloroflexi bacterium]|nr:L-ribulose-5-phosphate 3-epimerase [Anaerolineaceae bacterium]NLI44053.1 L-ribulose-5-phosphate 3-epimerase [Chloroflexota bacterium]HOE34225.1 L-ribulose-5-phosphate 3-epimerase [Anaerolineaceae bacterium]HOT25830.1 L-ribulose-5-phosphate 3-epimerase [Anaerolineaceae bacterium]HQH58121.1 L-ribulose-5-phosphate 3-epimerase [Anaerolineaceae bacterium]
MAAKLSFPIGIYEKALKPQPLPEMFADAVRAGYDTFEISLDESDDRLARLDWGAAEMRATRRAAEESGIRLFSACFSGHRKYALGSADPAIARRAMDLMRKGLDFCVETGIRVLQLTGSDVYYEPASEGTARRYQENAARAAEWAGNLGVMLAIEPVDKHIRSILQALELVREVNSPWLQVYPDAANLLAEGFEPLEELEAGQGHLVGLHIRDAVPGTSYNLPWGSGALDFEAVLRCLQKINFHAPLIIEYWFVDEPDYLERAVRAREFLVEKIARAGLE